MKCVVPLLFVLRVASAIKTSLFTVSGDKCTEYGIGSEFLEEMMSFDQSLSEGSCKSLGYVDLASSSTSTSDESDFGELTVDEYSKSNSGIYEATRDAEDSESHVLAIKGNTCFQSLPDSVFSGYLQSMGPLDTRRGLCSDHGYTVSVGNDLLHDILVTRLVDVHKFAESRGETLGTAPILKTSHHQQGTGSVEKVTIFSVYEKTHTCSESEIYEKDLDYAIHLNPRVSSGTCEGQGYTVPAGTSTIDIPRIGKLAVRKLTLTPEALKQKEEEQKARAAAAQAAAQAAAAKATGETPKWSTPTGQ